LKIKKLMERWQKNIENQGFQKTKNLILHRQM